jgi:hypothetical protein
LLSCGKVVGGVHAGVRVACKWDALGLKPVLLSATKGNKPGVPSLKYDPMLGHRHIFRFGKYIYIYYRVKIYIPAKQKRQLKAEGRGKLVRLRGAMASFTRTKREVVDQGKSLGGTDTVL